MKFICWFLQFSLYKIEHETFSKQKFMVRGPDLSFKAWFSTISFMSIHFKLYTYAAVTKIQCESNSVRHKIELFKCIWFTLVTSTLHVYNLNLYHLKLSVNKYQVNMKLMKYHWSDISFAIDRYCFPLFQATCKQISKKTHPGRKHPLALHTSHDLGFVNCPGESASSFKRDLAGALTRLSISKHSDTYCFSTVEENCLLEDWA